jgi:hypothetical protein
MTVTAVGFGVDGTGFAGAVAGSWFRPEVPVFVDGFEQQVLPKNGR